MPDSFDLTVVIRPHKSRQPSANTNANNCAISYLKFDIQVDGWAVVVEADEGVARDVDPVLHDPVRHLPGQVEDGVLVGLDGLGGVDDEDERGVERTIGGLTKAASGRLRARLAPGARYLHNHHKTNKINYFEINFSMKTLL